MKKNFVFGKKIVIEEIYNQNLSLIYYHKYFDELRYALKQKIPIYKKDKAFFSQFKDEKHGFVAGKTINKSFFVKRDFNLFLEQALASAKSKTILVILDEIQNVHNFGAICRSANAFAIDGIIFKKNNQVQLSDEIARSCKTNLVNFNFLQVANINTIIQKLKKNGFWILGTALTPDAVELAHFQNDFTKIALVVGNESDGIGPLVQKNCDMLLKISLQNKVQSLNVSVATALFLFWLIYK